MREKNVILILLVHLFIVNAANSQSFETPTYCKSFPYGLNCKNENIRKVQQCLGVKDDGHLGERTKNALEANGYSLPLTKNTFDLIMKGCGMSSEDNTTNSTNSKSTSKSNSSSQSNTSQSPEKDITWLKGKTFVFRGPSTTYLQFRDTYAYYVGNYTLKTSFGTSDCPFEFEMNQYVRYGIIVTINCEDESPYRLELEIDQKTGSLKSKNYQGGKQVIYTLTN